MENVLLNKYLWSLLACKTQQFIAKMNDDPTLMKQQLGPIVEQYGVWGSLKASKDPRYGFVIAFGTDHNALPSIVFKLGTNDNGNREVGWLMAEFPVRVVVRIAINTSDVTNKSVISVWTYDKYKRHGICFQQPEPLSTPGGRISSWASDFLSVQDDDLPDGYQRPYKEQYVDFPPDPSPLPASAGPVSR